MIKINKLKRTIFLFEFVCDIQLNTIFGMYLKDSKLLWKKDTHHFPSFPDQCSSTQDVSLLLSSTHPGSAPPRALPLNPAARICVWHQGPGLPAHKHHRHKINTHTHTQRILLDKLHSNTVSPTLSRI